MHFSELAPICRGTVIQLSLDRPIQTLLIDSRKAVVSEGSLFFAIRGERHDGHSHLEELYKLGIRQFVVEKKIDGTLFPDANILHVTSSVDVLQAVAAHHRQQYNILVVGITGSNGKTIIKEWLSQALAADYHLVKNPGSYNSQVGVPLSVWQMQGHHQLGIFEAGISRPGEMQHLQKIIRPTIGIFTNVGSAHDEGFADRKQKAEEKMQLFSNCEHLIYCADHELVDEIVRERNIPSLTWGHSAKADISIKLISENEFEIRHQAHSFHLQLPFADAASQENAFHVMAFLLFMKYTPAVIQERISALKSVPMRLELKQGINRCTVIDDSYNNDLAGLRISLDFLKNQQKPFKTLILSDVLQTGLPDAEVVAGIHQLVLAAGVKRFIGIGPVLQEHGASFPFGEFYRSTNDFLRQFQSHDFADQVVLVKGARPFQFEKIVKRLERKVHGTVMEVDLNAMVHNLNYFKSRLKPGTRLMAMVKAFAYGSGSEEVANLLQYHRVDYLGVAYADEGIELRKNNISLPIMVMNPTEESFPSLLEFDLEPEIYSKRIFNSLVHFLEGRPCQVHLKLDTGMHRLGFEEDELDEVFALFQANKNITVASVMSHLAGADESLHDDFSKQQADAFLRMNDRIASSLGYQPIRHLLNSPGILRLSQYQFDMVRLGIGLYGVDPTEEGKADLRPVATLKTIISQIKKIKAGDTIGYGRKGKALHDMTLATLAIGYADGFSRAFSRGKGSVLINGQRAPVVGNVCMDMTMVDITGIAAREGDEAIIFGAGLPIQQVARWIDTIPYEFLTSTSERVKRAFYAEGI